MFEEKNTQEENNEKQDLYLDQNREVVLGICFGVGIGVFAGAVINNVMLGLSAGGVVGAVSGVAVNYYRKFKVKRMLRKI